MPGLLALLVALTAFVAACTPDTAPPTTSPEPQAQFHPLDASISGIPGPDVPSAIVFPESRVGGWAIGAPQVTTLGHCGLASPLDFDGSLWDPAAAHDGDGGPVAGDQSGDLINATKVSITLIDPRTALMVSPQGAVVRLERHAGPRSYPLCD